jgi:conjugative transposon TraJ protein
MIKRKTIFLMTIGVFTSNMLYAQSIDGDVQSLRGSLDLLYDQMMPLCSQLIDVGRAIAGFAAIWYIASRIWRHIANAEQVDFYPLLRPFGLGFCIMLFPSVLALINGVMKPTITGTASMVDGSNNAISELLKRKEQAIMKTPYWQMYIGSDGDGDKEKWYRYTHPEGTEEGFFDGIGNDIKFAMAKASYNFRNSIKQWLSEILQLLFEAAGLCINTIRTFYLIVLAVLGPLVFGLSVFDGLQHTLRIWLARYINVFLWLPVANIFGSIIGKIQENMLKVDIGQVEKYGDTFFSSTDTAYMIFLVIGIVGYFTVPSVANYIVHAGGNNVLLFKSTSLFSAGSQYATNTTMSAGYGAGQNIGGYLDKKNESNIGGTPLQHHRPDSQASGGYLHKKVAGQ